MNIHFLRFLGKISALLFMGINSIFNFSPAGYKTVNIINQAMIKNMRPTSQIVKYNTEINYSYKIPRGKFKVTQEGINGIVKINDDKSETVLINMVPEKKTIGLGATGKFEGRLTGYGPDCEGCSPKGYVACKTRDRKYHSLITDGITYKDKDYGELRILAAAFKQFRCGTIINVTNTKIGDFKGIVLDTGSEMRKYEREGKVLLDLAYSSGKDSSVRFTTKNDVIFEVERWGW